jgi:hypothetical protein
MNSAVTNNPNQPDEKLKWEHLAKKMSLAAEFCHKGQIAKFMKISLVLMMILYN